LPTLATNPKKKNTGFEWGWTFSCVCFAVPRTCVHDRITTKFGGAHTPTRLLHFRCSFAAVRRVNLLTNLAGLTNLVGRLLLSCLLMDRELDLGAQFQLQTNYLSWISKVGSTPNNDLILKFLFRQVRRIFYNIPKISSFSFTKFFFFNKNIFWKFQHV